MSDRTVQVALLVILVAILTAAVLSLARLPSAAATPIAAALVGMASTAIGGIMILISRPANTVYVPPEKPSPPKSIDSGRK